MNKRALTVLSVLNGLFTILILVGIAIKCLAPQWLAGLESSLISADFNYKLFGGIFVIVNIVCTIVLFICNEVCYDQHCDLDDKPAEPEKTTSSGEAVYKTRLHFGRVKPEEEGATMKSKEERKAEREAAIKARKEKHEARQAKRAKKVETAVDEKIEKVEKHVDSTVDSFIKSLKK